MSLPAKVVDRLFERLAATYGRQWSALWSDTPVNDVKSAWSHELAGFSRNLEALAWALEHLPEGAPNVIQFRNLARQAPPPDAPKLPEPPLDAERVKAALRLLQSLTNPPLKEEHFDGLKWAKRIMQRVGKGDPPCRAAVTLAKEALARNGHAPDDFLHTPEVSR